MGVPTSWSRLSRMSPGALRRLQERGLRRQVREELYPFSAWYRALLDRAGVGPRELRGEADLARLPLTSRAQLAAAGCPPRAFDLAPSPRATREHWPFARKLALALGGSRAREVLRLSYAPSFQLRTAGRARDPLTLSLTSSDLALMGEAGARLFDVAGLTGAEERVLNLLPFGPGLEFWTIALGGLHSGRMVRSTGGLGLLDAEGHLRLIEELHPTALVGTPEGLEALLDRCRTSGADLSPVRAALCATEAAPAELRARLGDGLRAQGATEAALLSLYGFAEGRALYSECPGGVESQAGYHLYPDLGLLEVIDPETGRPLGEGETGEIVHTAIAGHGTALLRYRTGDLAIGGLTREPCPGCGRTVPRIGPEIRRIGS